jgi:hypothetical protein
MTSYGCGCVLDAILLMSLLKMYYNRLDYRLVVLGSQPLVSRSSHNNNHEVFAKSWGVCNLELSQTSFVFKQFMKRDRTAHPATHPAAQLTGLYLVAYAFLCIKKNGGKNTK